jgi:hypothetical protein
MFFAQVVIAAGVHTWDCLFLQRYWFLFSPEVPDVFRAILHTIYLFPIEQKYIKFYSRLLPCSLSVIYQSSTCTSLDQQCIAKCKKTLAATSLD